MVRNVDGIGSGITYTHRVGRGHDTFEDQLTLPLVAQAVQEIPINVSAEFIACESRLCLPGIGQHHVGGLWDALYQRLEDPGRVQCKIDEIPGLHPERHLQAMPALTNSRGNHRHIDGQNQVLITRFLGPCYEFQCAFHRRSDIELEPRIVARALPGLFDRAGTKCGKTNRHPIVDRCGSQRFVRTRPGQIAHPHRGNAEG